MGWTGGLWYKTQKIKTSKDSHKNITWNELIVIDVAKKSICCCCCCWWYLRIGRILLDVNCSDSPAPFNVHLERALLVVVRQTELDVPSDSVLAVTCVPGVRVNTRNALLAWLSTHTTRHAEQWSTLERLKTDTDEQTKHYTIHPHCVRKNTRQTM